jgi:hypothetical protein
MNNSRPLEILDIFNELWMGFSQSKSKVGLTHVESSRDFEKIWVNMNIGMDIFAHTKMRVACGIDQFLQF